MLAGECGGDKREAVLMGELEAVRVRSHEWSSGRSKIMPGGWRRGTAGVESAEGARMMLSHLPSESVSWPPTHAELTPEALTAACTATFSASFLIKASCPFHAAQEDAASSQVRAVESTM